MIKTKFFSLLTASALCFSCFGITAFADISYENGDVDMDGIITGHDTAMVSRHLLEDDYSLTDEQLALADVDGDGEVTQADADKLFTEMQTYAIGKVNIDTDDVNDDLKYMHLSDASEILNIYSYNGAGVDYGCTQTQHNLADINLSGAVDLTDASICLGFYVLLGAGIIEDNNPLNGVYYFSEDPESPAYVGNMYGTNIKDGNTVE